MRCRPFAFRNSAAFCAVWLAALIGWGSGDVLAQRAPMEVRLTEALIVKLLDVLKAPLDIKQQAEIEQLLAEEIKSEAAERENHRKLNAIHEAWVKRFGFASADEYHDVNFSFDKVRILIDQGAGPAIDAAKAIANVEASIAQIEGEKNIPADQRQVLVGEMRTMLSELKAPRFPENLELYKRMKPQIDAVLRAQDEAMKAQLDARPVSQPPR